jgi:hypothetical protein
MLFPTTIAGPLPKPEPVGDDDATFETLPGASFVVNGAAQSHNSAPTAASAESKWLDGFSAATPGHRVD